MIKSNPFPAADQAAIECAILNEMRPPSASKIGDEWTIDGLHFGSMLKHRASDPETWNYLENGGRIGFECKEMRWSNGTVVKIGADASVGVIDAESSPVSLTYPDAFGAGIGIKIIQDNYRWQKIVEIESLAALGEIPADAEYLEISFKVSGDFDLPDGVIDKRIPFGENSFIQHVRAWDSSPENPDAEIPSGAFGEVKDGVLTKRIPVAWLKSAVYPVHIDTTITYGAVNVFNPATTYENSVTALDATHFVVAYKDVGNSNRGTAIVGLVSGTTIRSYGAENVFNPANTDDISITALDATHFVVAYKDVGNSDRGTAIVGFVSGTTISSYGAENVFNSAATDDCAVTALDATHFVVAYRDTGNSNYGTAIVGLVSGTAISSYGAENVFNSATTYRMSVTALDATHFVVAYRDVSTGAARVGLVSGTTISSYGAENVFNPTTECISVTALDATHFVVAYQDQDNSDRGTARVGLVSGTTISSYGAENVFNSATTAHISVTALDATHFVVAYKDYGNSNYGTAIAGLVLGTAISSYGAETVFNSGGTDDISITALDATRFAVAYRDWGDSSYGTAIVGTTEVVKTASTTDVSAVGTKVDTVDGLHDVPVADVVDNAQMRDVIGNKTDAAVTAVGTENSLIAYQKGVLNQIPAVSDVVIYPVAEHAATTEIADDGTSPAFYADNEDSGAGGYVEGTPFEHWVEDIDFEQEGSIDVISIFAELRWQHKTSGGTAYSKVQMSRDGGSNWVDMTDSIAETNVAYQDKTRVGVGRFVTTITAGANQLQMRLVSWVTAPNVSSAKMRSDSYIRITYRKS